MRDVTDQAKGRRGGVLLFDGARSDKQNLSME